MKLMKNKNINRCNKTFIFNKSPLKKKEKEEERKKEKSQKKKEII